MSDVMTGARGVPKSDPIGAGRGLGVPRDRNRQDTTVRVARTLAFGGKGVPKSEISTPVRVVIPKTTCASSFSMFEISARAV